jgi:3-hydroxyacyl-CoA dehydrogenase
MDPRIRKVAVLGSGLIGASWAALFAAYKLQTIVYDPTAKAESGLWSEVASAYKVLSRLDNVPKIGTLEDMQSLISFTTDLSTAVQDANIIQENIPEKLQLKLDLYGELEMHMKPDTLVLSSTSGIPPSQPGRIPTIRR